MDCSPSVTTPSFLFDELLAKRGAAARISPTPRLRAANSSYFVCEGAAGAGAGTAGAGAVRVCPTVALGAVLAEWFVSRGQKNSAPTMRTAAAMAAQVPVLTPLRVPVVVRVSRSSLILSLHSGCTSQNIAVRNVPRKAPRSGGPDTRREPMVHPHPAFKP